MTDIPSKLTEELNKIDSSVTNTEAVIDHTKTINENTIRLLDKVAEDLAKLRAIIG
jgi:hypothetical protein